MNDCLRLSTTNINGQTPERLPPFVKYVKKYGQPPERLSSFVNYENKRTDT